MRVLIVDDNSAIRDVISDILLMSDHVVASADTSDNAILRLNELRPDVIFLDADTDTDNISKFLDAVSREVPRRKLYMLTKNDDVPSGVIIDGHIRKPFKGTDILELVNTPPGTDKKKRTFLKGLQNKRQMPAASKNNSAYDAKLRFGNPYIFVENEPSEVWGACIHFLEKGDDIMAITSGNIKAVRERIRDNNIRVSALSEGEGKDRISGSKIGSVMDVISTFIGSAKRPVIVIDDLRMLIQMNDLNSVLTMVQQTMNNGHGKNVTILASMCPDGITERDTKLLLHNMIEYKTDR
jgi:CheY-like chemotaxis protein